MSMGPPVLAGWGPPCWDVVQEMGMPTAGVPILLSGEELFHTGARMLLEPVLAVCRMGPCPITGDTGQGATGSGKGGAWRRMDESQSILPKGQRLHCLVPPGWAPLVPPGQGKQ